MTDDEIFQALKDDILKAREADIDIDLSGFGVIAYRGETYSIWYSENGKCSVCIIGARLLGKTCHSVMESKDFADSLGKSFQWGRGFLHNAFPEDCPMPVYDDRPLPDDYVQGREMAQKMKDWLRAEGIIK
jgi:hypothetical protein